MSDSKFTRRKFFVHSAHATIGVSAGLMAWQANETAEALWAGQAPATLRVCLISGCPHYDSDESLPILQKLLEEKYRVQCERAFHKGDAELPGLDALDRCDTAVFFTRRMKIAGEPLEQIQRYCRSGKGIVGIRTASHGFQNWLEMDKEVFGGDYQGHYGNQTVEVKLVEAAKDHPVLAGVEPFTSRGSLYKNPNVAKDVTVLLTGAIPGATHPVAWVRLHGKARVFYTSLGALADFKVPSFLRLLVNAIFWTAWRKAP